MHCHSFVMLRTHIFFKHTACVLYGYIHSIAECMPLCMYNISSGMASSVNSKISCLPNANAKKKKV